MIEKYLESDEEENNQNYNEVMNKVINQPYTPNFKRNSNLNQNKINNNEINNNNEIPMEEMKIKPSGWKNNAAYMNINKAVQENRGRKEYTAHTYSTIQKIKNLNDKKKKKSKKKYYLIIFRF